MLKNMFQFAGDIRPTNSQPIGELFTDCRRMAVSWARGTGPYARFSHLPSSAYAGESFSLDQQGQSLESIFIPEDARWSMRLMHPDNDTPKRTWISEVSLRCDIDRIHFGLKTSSSTFGGENFYKDAVVKVPRIISNFARKFDLINLRKVDGLPWNLRDASDLNLLFDYLTDLSRDFPVIILTEPAYVGRGLLKYPFVLDSARLALDTIGSALICTMPSTLGVEWSRLVGKEWSAYYGAVRVFKPSLRIGEDSPYQHPLYFFDRVLSWTHDNGETAEDGFCSYLVEQVLNDCSTKRVDWKNIKFLIDSRNRQAQIEEEEMRMLIAVNIKGESQVEFGQQISSLEKLISAQDALITQANAEQEQWSDDAAKWKIIAEEYKEKCSILHHQNESLRAALSGRVQDNSEEERLPENYREMFEWTKKFTGRLELLPRARKGLKEADYHDLPLVCDCLASLATTYRDMNTGHATSEQWQGELEKLGVECSQSISDVGAGEEGDTYFVKYPPESERKQRLDMHLTKGNDRESRYCLRIYFFWDEPTQKVCVGWLTSHLSNRLT